MYNLGVCVYVCVHMEVTFNITIAGHTKEAKLIRKTYIWVSVQWKTKN